MRAISLLFVVLSLAMFAACGDEVDTQAAEDAVRVRIEQLSRGEYAAAWATMHPSHQALVSETQFVECGRELQLQRDPTVDSVTIIDTESRTIEIPGIGETDVVTIEAELRTGETARRSMFDQVEVDGQWRWILNDASIRAFQSGNCPA